MNDIQERNLAIADSWCGLKICAMEEIGAFAEENDRTFAFRQLSFFLPMRMAGLMAGILRTLFGVMKDRIVQIRRSRRQNQQEMRGQETKSHSPLFTHGISFAINASNLQ
ncbi:MAG: hypothetical protein CMI31_04585 [Opitutae bacterium]|nr:hypothetical protein [Opitutae bacterium]|tara:strand:+ start:3119 stop:3448 length:330 start_codon:yes stop_codon:yes gene_type:complete